MDTLNHVFKQKQFKFFSRYIYAFAGIVGINAAITLLGWALNIDFLKQPLGKLPTMNPTTAVGLMVAGVAIVLIVKGKLQIARLLALLVVGIGALKSLAIIYPYLDTQIDHWLFGENVQASFFNGFANNIALNTIVCFWLLGGAVLLTCFTNTCIRTIAAYLAIFTTIVSYFAVIGNIYKVNALYGFANTYPMAIQTAVSFGLLSMAVLLLNSNYGFMQTYTSRFAGGSIARLLLPPIVFIPALLGYLRLWANNSYIVGTEMGVAILITLIITMLLGVTWILALALNKSDKARSEAELSLKKINTNLEKTVDSKTKELLDYQFALDESSIVAITDKDGTITHANDNFCRISKFERAELIGKKHNIINSGYHPKEFFADLWKTILAGNIWRGEVRNKAKDGSLYWVDTTIVPFLNEQKKPYQYVVIRVDITNKKMAEEALNQLNASLETRVKERTAELQKANEEIAKRNIYFDQTQDAFLAVSFDGSFLDFNARFMQLLGYEKEELMPIPFISLVHQNDLDNSRKELENIALSGKTENFENRFRCKNGTYIWMQWNAVLYNKNIYAVGRNVSLQKQQQEDLLLNTEKLNRANKELESYSYSVSHDLRAPLRAVNGFIQVIERQHVANIPPEMQTLFNHITANTLRMNNIIEDLLTLAKYGKQKLNLTPVDMKTLFTKVWNNVQTTNPTAVLELADLPGIRADASMIEQVVINLLSNAIKYSGKVAEPHICVGYTESEKSITYFVKDNGAGFNMQHAYKIFDAFQRLHTSSDFEGTGVGLHLVKQIIENHGGSIWAEGKINEGATFWFSLPKTQ